MPNGQRLYREIQFKGENLPTIILLNGLTYTTQAWSKLVKSLQNAELNVVTYDPCGMGNTLEDSGPEKDVIPLDTQVEDLYLLIQELRI